MPQNGGNTTKIHYRSRFAPSLGSGSTAKISHREIFSAQDDTNEDCLEFLFKIIKIDVYGYICTTTARGDELKGSPFGRAVSGAD